MSRTDHAAPGSLLPLGRLLRLSLSMSAIADVAVGIVVGAGYWPRGAGPWLLILSSLAVYHGGMALNDWADRERDARTRPERPLPSGEIDPRFALGLAFLLLSAAPLLAFLIHPILGTWALGLSVVAAFYDLRGRGPLLGPFCLALCRGGNLAMGIVLGRLALHGFLMEPPGDQQPEAGGAAPAGPWIDALTLVPPLFYAAYVFLVSRLGRMEDSEDKKPLGRRPARLVSVMCGLFLVLPLVPLPEIGATIDNPAWLAKVRIPLASLISAAGAFALLRRAFRIGTWSRGDVLATMGLALRRLLVFTSVLAIVRGTEAGLLVAAVVLLGVPASRALRKVFPPS